MGSVVVLSRDHSGVCITLNRPDVHSAIIEHVIASLQAAFDALRIGT